MYTFICNKCSGLGGYIHRCQCGDKINCPDCCGNGNYYTLCKKCGGTGIIEIKLYQVNNNMISLDEIAGHS
jgi:hypothetical protein